MSSRTSEYRGTYGHHQQSFSVTARYKLVFWLAVGLFSLLSLMPRADAQSAECAPFGGSEPQSYPCEHTFVISAYYSPLPDQSVYFTGSYASDIRLNGNGTNGADGTEVYPGMIAAPPAIPFGTKMVVPGIGTVAVHDRGGAIKGNRLDVWMGQGEEGLARALSWGKRSVRVVVLGKGSPAEESVELGSLSLASLSHLSKKVSATPAASVAPQYESLKLGESGDRVRELQYFLKSLSYFDAEPTGYFGQQTFDAVMRLQFDRGIVDDPEDDGAGVFGPQTRSAFDSVLAEQKAEELADLPTGTYVLGASGEAVLSIQRTMNRLGYTVPETGLFGPETERMIRRFQINEGVITNSADFGSGVFGPKTGAALRSALSQRWTLATQLVASANSGSTARFATQMKLDDSSPAVRQLQLFLRDLNFLRLEPTGHYGKSTEHAVFKFQQAFGLVGDETSPGAGIVGPLTMARLNDLAGSQGSQQLQIVKTTDSHVLVGERIQQERVFVALTEPLAFSDSLKAGARGDEVEKLQSLLKSLGFFPGRVTTDYFGEVTYDSLVSFQRSHGLEPTGVVDQPTRRTFEKIASGS